MMNDRYGYYTFTLVLGPPNDLISSLKKRKKTSSIMKKFLLDMKWKPEGRGGKFAGPTMRLFLSQYYVELGQRLEAVDKRLAVEVVEYCKSLWSLYKMSVSKKLCPDYWSYIKDYTAKFLRLYDRIQLPFTLKQHIIVSHVGEYFDLTKQSLRASSEEYLESTHSALRQMEEKFRLRTKGRKRGTSIHQERLLRSSYLYNFSRLGFLPHQYEDDDDDTEFEPPPQSCHMDHSYCLQTLFDQ